MATIVDYLTKRAKILRQTGPNIFIECPGCGTRKLKCAIHIHKGYGNCFRATCELNGGFGFARLISLLDNIPYSEALGVANEYSDEIEKEFKAKTFGANRNYPKGSLPAQELLNLAEYKGDKLLYYLALHGIEYLALQRSLTQSQIEQYQLGIGYENVIIGTKEIPRYGSIIIPVFFNQELVSYVGRSIEYQGGMLSKRKHHLPLQEEGYLMPGQILFNCDVAIPYAQEVGYLTIVEDAWSAIKHRAVATFGSNLSDDQIYILVNNWDGPVVICRDNDKGGQKAAKIDAKKLSKYYRDVRIAVPHGVDPDDDVEATKEKIKAAAAISLFELQLTELV